MSIHRAFTRSMISEAVGVGGMRRASRDRNLA
jgi:hypothetical protein